MRFLITGGAGFIGSHLADELLARGDRVHVLDDLSTGSMDNIAHLKGHEGFDYTIDSAARSRGRGAGGRGGRRLPPGGRGRRRAGRGEPRPRDRDQRPLHRGPARSGEKKKTGARRLDQRGLREERGAAIHRGRRSRSGIDHTGALGLRLLEGGRRVPRDRLLAGAGPADGGGPAVQHGRTQADRPLRHGRPPPGEAGARGSPSRSTATATSAAASATSGTWSSRSPT